MDKHLKSQLSRYIKQVERKSFNAGEILKKEEVAVIYAYTEDMYEPLNERLRRNLGQLDTEFGKELDRILAKLPNFEGIIFRGTSLTRRCLTVYEEAFKNYTPITEHAFLSTSRVESTAKMYMRTSREDYRVLFIILCKQGKNIEQYSKYGTLSGQDEREILFRANSQFEIVDIDKSNTSIVITLNEIIKNGTA